MATVGRFARVPATCAVALALLLALPPALFAQRPRPGGSAGTRRAGSAPAARSTAGASVRQTRTGTAAASTRAAATRDVGRANVSTGDVTRQVRRGNVDTGDINIGNEVNVDIDLGDRHGYHVDYDEVDVYRGWRGAVAVGDEGAIAVGRRGVAVVGEDHALAVGRYGGVYYGERYDSYDAWRLAAGVMTGIAIGTMLATPPPQYTTVVVAGSTYYVHDFVYYSRVYHGGEVVYMVVAPPAGAVISVLPAGCTTVVRGGVAYRQCGGAFYQPFSGGYRVVVFD